MESRGTFSKMQLDTVQTDANIVLPNPIRDSFRTTANHVFKDNTKVKIFLSCFEIESNLCGSTLQTT